jgi:hypothetical protein
MDPRIIKLGPSTDKVGVVSFEEAFGEHSELRGRGRARRQAKKLKRISNRGVRKAARQKIRAQQQEARQVRKDTRKARRVARKEMAPVEEETAVEEEQEEPVAEASYQEEQDNQSQYADPAAEDDNYDTEEDPASEGSDSFDGEEMEGAEGRRNMHPEIKDITQRIVWHKEGMRRHGKRRDALKKAYTEKAHSNFSSGNREDLSEYRSAIEGQEMELQKHEERVSQLEGRLKSKYAGHPHIPRGFKRANDMLQKSKEQKANADDQKAVKATIVSEKLNPEISNERIDIPAGNSLREIDIQSNFGGPSEKKGMPMVAKVAIGVGVLALAYYVAKKYKVI